jgi:O-antigen ligase
LPTRPDRVIHVLKGRHTIVSKPAKSNRPLGAPTGAAAVWLERGLGGCVLALPPLLALIPHAAAPLVGVAGLCAAGLLVADRRCRFDGLRWPAALLGALLVWGAMSALWSIDPERSLVMEARLAALFAAALALAAAADRLAAPQHMRRLVLIAAAAGIAVALIDLATAGRLSGYLTVRPFATSRFNQVSTWLAMLVLPTAALLALRRRPLALVLPIAMVATVCLLEGTTAKVALALSLPVAALIYLRRGAVARLAAVLAILGILSAPLTLPHLDRVPGVFAAADRIKGSFGHRLMIWSFAGDRIAERPFVGWGLDSARAVPGGADEIRPGQQWLPLHPHNAALQLWLELGAPGAALLALIVAWLWLALAQAAWPRIYAAAAGGGLTVALAAASSGWGIWEEWWIATLAMAAFAIQVMARSAANRDQGNGNTR